MTEQEIKALFARDYVGPKEISALKSSFLFGEIIVPAVPFSDDVLKKCAGTYILIFTPSIYADGRAATINSLRDLFGTDPAGHEPCMYNQDWYLHEDFAQNTALDGGWHLIPRYARDDSRAKRPEDIEETFTKNELFPTAVTYAFTFFVYWFHSGGEGLWKNDFLWCSDRDHNGDRIYVGCYEDPDGVNKNGFNIHRHLSLRAVHSAAPEIVIK